jgi:hypothetical protein
VLWTNTADRIGSRYHILPSLELECCIGTVLNQSEFEIHIQFCRYFFQTAEERSAFKFNNETHLQPILTFLETTLNKVCTVPSYLIMNERPVCSKWYKSLCFNFVSILNKKNIFPFPLATSEWTGNGLSNSLCAANCLPHFFLNFSEFVAPLYRRFCNHVGYGDIICLSSNYPYWQRQKNCWREMVVG